MVTTNDITSAEQLLATVGPGRCELIRGELVMMTPAGFRRGRIACAVAAILRGSAVKDSRSRIRQNLAVLTLWAL